MEKKVCELEKKVYVATVGGIAGAGDVVADGGPLIGVDGGAVVTLGGDGIVVSPLVDADAATVGGGTLPCGAAAAIGGAKNEQY